MRPRQLVSSLVALCVVAGLAGAQDTGDRFADGLVPGDYLRLGVGVIAPVRAQGGLRDWSRGQNFAIAYENWGAGQTGVSNVAYGLSAEYGRLPLNTDQFLADFTPAANVHATSATASSATTFLIGTNLRVRIPAPFIMPSLSFGFSFIDYKPSTIHYTSSAGDGTTSQQHRRGAAFSFGAGLDKHIVDRFGLFGEAVYSYGFTSLGQGYATPGGTCANTNGCDVLKNTTLGVIRGGLRIQTTR
jgi:hypothetical protein